MTGIESELCHICSWFVAIVMECIKGEVFVPVTCHSLYSIFPPLCSAVRAYHITFLCHVQCRVKEMSDAGDEDRAPQGTSPVSADALRTIPLLNSMVDVAIVFGFDETCCRELVVLDEDEVMGSGMGKEGGGGGRNGREGRKDGKGEERDWGRRRGRGGKG